MFASLFVFVVCVQVFQNVEMEGVFDGFATVLAGDSFCVRKEINDLFSGAVFDYGQKMWFVKPHEWDETARARFTELGLEVDVVQPDEAA